MAERDKARTSIYISTEKTDEEKPANRDGCQPDDHRKNENDP
jgi:hypothetical protein